MNAPLLDPELILHVFAQAEGPEAADARHRLAEIWAACREQLGMDQLVPGTGLPNVLPEQLREQIAGTPVAAAQSPGNKVFQMVLHRHYGMYTLSLVLAPDSGSPGWWAEADALWNEIIGASQDGLIGEARLFLAKTSQDVSDRTVAQSVRDAMAQVTDNALRDQSVSDGFAVWEASARADTRMTRRLAIVAPAVREPELSAWTWSHGGLEAPPLARYLAHAAKIRHALRTWDDGRPLRNLRQRVNTAVDGLLDLISTGSREPEPISTASAGLTALLADRTGLVVADTWLRETRRGVEISISNMRAFLPEPPDESSPFAADLILAEWFLTRLDDDLIYVVAVRDRAREVAALTDRVLTASAQAREQASRHRQEQFGLLQAALIGAVLMVLTAIQALGYQVPVPEEVKPAIVAALGAVVLLLSMRALVLALPARRAALVWAYRGAAALTAVTLVWTALSWILD
ncbi:BN6_48550 family protein [Streptomyces sp. NBC_01390]|uniref:CATRA conflict system CASPASE/TPR repeat-associated protein n=1 Tax=Streptomyces sp. NBC_01390 TaxID=2903850 RepID=UPI00324DE718